MSRGKRKIAENVLIYLFLIIIGVLLIFPIYWMMATSIKDPLIAKSRIPIFIFKPTLENYSYLMTKTRYPTSFLNSFIVATGHTLLILFLSFPVAYFLSRIPMRGKSLVSYVVLLTRCIPPIGIAIPLYLLYRDMGLYNTRVGLMFLYILLNLSFSVWLLKSFIDGISPELEEAGKIDGCSRIQVMIKITLPLIAPGVVATSIYVFCVAWSEFMFAFIFTGFESRTLPVELQSYITPMGIKWAPMSAGGTLIVIPTILFYIFIKKYLVRGLTLGGVKE